MTKKIIALCALMSINSFMCTSVYPVQQGYEQNQQMQSDPIVDDADARSLRDIEEEEKQAFMYTNTARIGFAIGVVLATGGLISGYSNLTAAGGFLATGSAIGGITIGRSDNHREKVRTQKKQEILNRRSQYRIIPRK